MLCVFAASVLQAMAVLVCAEMYQVKRLQHLCEVCVCAYLQSMPSRELASTGISVIRLLRRAKVSPICDTTFYSTSSGRVEVAVQILFFIFLLCSSVPQRRAAVRLAPPLYRQQLPDLQPQTRLPGALRSAILLTFSKKTNKKTPKKAAVTVQNLTFPTHFSQILVIRRNKVFIFHHQSTETLF